MKIFQNINSTFYKTCLLFYILGFFPLILYTKEDFFLLLNSRHHVGLDYFFSYINILGSGYTYLVILISLFLIKPYRSIALTGLISFFFITCIIQGIKYLLPTLRPVHLLASHPELYLPEKIIFNEYFSFPSGHAATIFSISGLWMFTNSLNNFILEFCITFFTFCVAYARVYLVQHFYTDIYIGSLIGFWITYIVVQKCKDTIDVFIQ